VSVVAIVLIVIAAVLLVLFVGGLIATSRRRARMEGELQRAVAAANQELAKAHAEDRGWHPELVEQAAREAFAQRHPGAPIEALHLVQVVDRPGTDEDEAVFQIVSGHRRETIHLGRRDGAWLSVPS